MRSRIIPLIVSPLRELVKDSSIEDGAKFNGVYGWNFMRSTIEEHPEYRTMRGSMSREIGAVFLLDEFSNYQTIETLRDFLRFSCDILVNMPGINLKIIEFND